MRILFAITVASAIFCSSSWAEQRKLNIAATEYPPYYGKDLENNGFMSEIIVTAFKRSGHDIDIKFLPWKRALESTKAGKHDGLFTIWHRKEREEWFVFSKPLPANELGFYRRKDQDIAFTSFDNLKSYTIGIVRGYVSPPGFDEAGLKTSLAKDDEENLRKLHKGRVDLVLADKVVAQHIISTKIPDAVSELEWIDPPAHTDIQYLVISKKAEDYAATLADFNTGLAEIEADGTLQAIMAKHGF